jgi:hypothetical protein
VRLLTAALVADNRDDDEAKVFQALALLGTICSNNFRSGNCRLSIY